jgi:cellulose biosynthesis protein BcsQ
MAVILCQGLKGGTGTTFVAAHLAMALTAQGVEATLLAAGTAETTGLHFGLPPSTPLPSLTSAEPAVVVGGVALLRHADPAADARFEARLHDLAEGGSTDRLILLDLPPRDTALLARLAPHADAIVRPLHASPDCLALLPGLSAQSGVAVLARTLFIINAIDETRRLSRHCAKFLGELAGDRVLGNIRLDEAVPEAIAMLKPLSRYAPSSVALADAGTVAGRLVERLRAFAPASDSDRARSQAA